MNRPTLVEPLSPRTPSSRADSRSDGQLVESARSGDEAALEALFRRHIEPLRVLAGRMLPADVERDDVVQECFAVALGELWALRDPEAFRPWLRGVLVHLAKSRLRRRRLLRELGLWAPHDDLDGACSSSTPPPDVFAELRSARELMDRLAPDVRRALLLYRAEGLSFAELAGTLGVSISTAKRLVGRAAQEFEVELARNRRR